MTFEQLVEIIHKNAVGVVDYIDDDDPLDVVIDGHYNLDAVVKAINERKE